MQEQLPSSEEALETRQSEGPKNRETDHFERLQENGAQYSETRERCNCGSHPRRWPSETGGFPSEARTRDTSRDLGEGEREGAE